MTPRPLEVRARLAGPVLRGGEDWPALDALLAWAVVRRDAIPVALTAAECIQVAIPVERESDRRFYLASFGAAVVEAHRGRWTNRRFPVEEAQLVGSPKIRRIDVGAGACRTYRIPQEEVFLRDDAMAWWCVGDEAGVRALLVDHVGYLGRRRAVGGGRVAAWEVAPCVPWGEGFPVVRDGLATRTLPLDWPGLTPDHPAGYRTLTYPYWDRAREEMRAVATWAP